MISNDLKLIINALKEDRPENVLLLGNDADLITAVITWPRVPITFRSQEVSEYSLAAIWRLADVDMVYWSKISGIKIKQLKALFEKLSLNEIIYPDNTCSSIVMQFIKKKALTELKKVLGGDDGKRKSVGQRGDDEVNGDKRESAKSAGDS